MAIDFEITNFQAHPHTKFKVSGFTVIMGPSHIGKSSLSRAIDKAIQGARRANFIRDGESSCKTKITFHAHNISIEWERSKGISSMYRVTFPDGHIESYERKDNLYKISLDVPEVANLRIFGVEIQKTKLQPQFSGQHDPLFFIFNTHELNYKFLLSISSQSKLLDTISNIKSDIVSRNRSLKLKYADQHELSKAIENIPINRITKALQSVINTIPKTISLYTTIANAHENLIQCKTLIEHTSATSQITRILTHVINKAKPLTDLKNLITFFSEVSLLSISVSMTTKLLNFIMDACSQFRNATIFKTDFNYGRLLTLNADIHNVSDNLSTHVAVVSHLTGISEKLEHFKTFSTAASLYDKLNTIKNEQQYYTDEISKVNISQEDNTNKINQLTEELGGICPLCNNPLTKEHTHG